MHVCVGLVCVRVWECACVCVAESVRVYVCACGNVCMCMRACACVRMCVCVWECVKTHTCLCHISLPASESRSLYMASHMCTQAWFYIPPYSFCPWLRVDVWTRPVPEVLNDFNAQGVANTIWACAKSGFVHLKLMNALAERAMHPEVVPGTHPFSF